ncbi:disulfide bond formation protein DsbB [Sphingomonas jejuensis]|uniref:Disulfide bond formation protein DsbB n=1 Tax=Sphingomonas jejuensis TaxID=904715 RepID=A0ABX0XP36_9SPHN|nr:disulfide bond formation protein DsbB [Sphingomonas jejuensis]
MDAGPVIRRARLLALAAPALLLAGALLFQFAGGLYPCEMCVWQRWPHVAAIGLALAAFATRGALMRVLVFSAGVAILVSAGVALFHAGVEYGWWEGITGCATMGGGAGRSDADILADIMAAPIIRCDVAPWSLFGISLAGYNAILSGLSGAVVLLMVGKATRSVR